MINLIYSPQRAEFKAEYTVNGDALTVKIGEISETFDFAGLPEGAAEEIVTEGLPVNPIVSVEKTVETVNVTAIRFYREDEKDIYEVVEDA